MPEQADLSSNPLPEQDMSSDLWALHREQIASQLRPMMKFRTSDTPEEQAEKFRTALVSEQRFMNGLQQVITRAMQDTRAKKLLLFDVDETIVRARIDDSGLITTLIRPSLSPLLERMMPAIEAGILEVGILSSRSKERLIAQLADPAHLQPMAKYINPARLYSSRGDPSHSDFELLQSRDIVNKTVVGEAPYSKHRLDGGDYQKITTLQRIKDENPDTAIIAVDDFKYPGLLDEQKGMYGYALSGEEAFWI